MPRVSAPEPNSLAAPATSVANFVQVADFPASVIATRFVPFPACCASVFARSAMGLYLAAASSHVLLREEGERLFAAKSEHPWVTFVIGPPVFGLGDATRAGFAE